MEKILDIKEDTWSTGKYSEFDGFVITTDNQIIKIGISNSQSCCENWGYLTTEDNIKEFIGTNLLSIQRVDTLLKKHKEVEELQYLDEGDAMFINLETSNGLLQFVVYNAHNGYYGHEAVVISKDLNISETL